MPEKSHVEPGDPRWIGAWWLGYAFIATAIFLSTIPMILFPKKMHAGSEANREEVAVKTKLDSDFTGNHEPCALPRHPHFAQN